jgi:gamma-glutamyltranspeptidase/glutathione hydrolase
VVFTTRPELLGTHGMVASTHWLASAAGMAMLERGGNAFGAAVAAGLVLQVVEPHLNGPGGDLPILGYDAGRGRPLVVAGQGPAPAAASIARFRDLGLDLVPGTGLLDPGYAAGRRRLVGEDASMELRPGSPGGHPPRLPGTLAMAGEAAAAEAGEPTVGRLGGETRIDRVGGETRIGRVGGDTCHVDTVDRFGNMVSATPSGGWLQSSPVVAGLGFALGTRAQMFWLEEGLPNSLAPGKRPRTTLSPSLALRDGQGALAFGTPGGDGQDQWSLQLFLAHVHFGLDLQAAIDAPAFQTTAFPSSFWPREHRPGEVEVEERLGAEAVQSLRRRGHRVAVTGPWSLGRLSAVAREPGTGLLRAAANPRGMQGYAVGR